MSKGRWVRQMCWDITRNTSKEMRRNNSKDGSVLLSSSDTIVHSKHYSCFSFIFRFSFVSIFFCVAAMVLSKALNVIQAFFNLSAENSTREIPSSTECIKVIKLSVITQLTFIKWKKKTSTHNMSKIFWFSQNCKTYTRSVCVTHSVLPCNAKQCNSSKISGFSIQRQGRLKFNTSI